MSGAESPEGELSKEIESSYEAEIKAFDHEHLPCGSVVSLPEDSDIDDDDYELSHERPVSSFGELSGITSEHYYITDSVLTKTNMNSENQSPPKEQPKPLFIKESVSGIKPWQM